MADNGILGIQRGIDLATTKIDEIQRTAGATGEKVDSLEARVRELEEQKEALEALLAKSQSALALPGLQVGKNGEKDAFSFARSMQLITGVANMDSKEHGYEAEMFRQMSEKFDSLPEVTRTALNVGTGAGGGFLVSTEVMADIVPQLEAFSIASALGVTRIDNLNGNVGWARDEGGILAEYIDTEAEANGNDSVATFASIEIRPHVLAAFVPLTYRMLLQPAMAIEGWIRQRIAMKIALREDLSILAGTGQQGEPRGLQNTTGIQTFDWSATTADYAGADQNISTKIRNIVRLVANANGLVLPNVGWGASPDAVFGIAQTKDADGREVFTAPGDVMPKTLGTFPVQMTTQLDDAANTDEGLTFGPWSQVINGHWGTLAFASSGETETNFRKLRTTVRAVGAHDVCVLQPDAFVNVTNCDVTAVVPA